MVSINVGRNDVSIVVACYYPSLFFSTFHLRIFRIYLFLTYSCHLQRAFIHLRKKRRQMHICRCRRWHCHQPPKISFYFIFQLEAVTSHCEWHKMLKHWVGKSILPLTIVCSFCFKAHHITSNKWDLTPNTRLTKMHAHHNADH